jgi:hypothetical protein
MNCNSALMMPGRKAAVSDLDSVDREVRVAVPEGVVSEEEVAAVAEVP